MSDADSTWVDAVLEALGAKPGGPLAAFAELSLRRAPRSMAADPASMAARLRSLFGLMEERRGATAVRAFNPDPAQHGFEAAGTVVQVNVADGPFLLDSVRNEIEAHGLGVDAVLHPVVGVERSAAGGILEVRNPRKSAARESVQHYELDRRLFGGDLPGLEQAVSSVLAAVDRAVADFVPMRERLERMVELVETGSAGLADGEAAEVVDFLRWLGEGNFVFLGYREYRIVAGPSGATVETVPGSGLGILRDEASSATARPVPLTALPPEVAERYRGGDLLMITKTNRLSPVYRRARMDYVAVRMIGPDGATVGEARLLGFFSSRAYMEPAARTPILRRKLAEILASGDLIEGSHDHRLLFSLFESHSKHDLFGAPTEELRQSLLGMLDLQELRQVRVLMRRDRLRRSVAVVVALPRDRLTPALRRDLDRLLRERFGTDSVDYHLSLGGDDLAQLHFTVWLPSRKEPEVEYEELEREVRSLTRTWQERIAGLLADRVGSEAAEALAAEWAPRFPDYYTASTGLGVAAGDILALADLEGSSRDSSVGIQEEEETAGQERLTRIALYRRGGRVTLSDLMPALENLGLRVVEEVPTRLAGPGGYFIHDFGVLLSDGGRVDPEGVGARVVEALEAVWGGGVDSDDLDRLVVSAGLRREEVEILRAYRTYWRRVAPVFSIRYIDDTLVAHPGITADLMRLFRHRFDPAAAGVDEGALADSIATRLDAIPSIEEDRILRSFLRLIEATTRTNAFVAGRECLAFKFVSAQVPDAPRPHPMAEVFVIAPTVEGVHLRGGKVARGGIRWSTRREDYRTEVLGLLKAQMTKNAVIVPTGAKGGFVLRDPAEDPAGLRAAVESAYRVFIHGLLDLTDNMVGGRVVPPTAVRGHDGDDPYLVVAADKGTATFSDVANGIAVQRGFWLGDAFASGGSKGYDHKALAITARGAWECLRQHLGDIGIDPESGTFTVVGIGDMSGDVFGNGMLLSDRIRLVAAFDHRHIFLDPDPDPGTSFAERRRLFDLPTSSWAEYDTGMISTGGGVYPRTLKRIDLSPEAARALDVEGGAVTPTELIGMILRAPVDLIWNGGIGTYVKASHETDEDAGDRANDAVRVDGTRVRARVVVEGGNLGLTQAGRIEYARSGGRVNTDFIDNSGGVDCSDREVNLKIVLAMAVARGDLEGEERDRLIASVAGDVVERVLRSNSRQAAVLGREERVAPNNPGDYEDLMADLEQAGLLDRGLESLPTTDEMADRSRRGDGLTRPELAVLLAYAKRRLQQGLSESPLCEDPMLHADLEQYFPPLVVEQFGDLIGRHPLRRELVATRVANNLVNTMGIVFVSRVMARTGSDPAAAVAAYLGAREVTGYLSRRAELEALVGRVDPALLDGGVRRLDTALEAVTRRYLAEPTPPSPADWIERDRLPYSHLEASVLGAGPIGRDGPDGAAENPAVAGFPEGIARHQALLPILSASPDILEVASGAAREPGEVADLFLATAAGFGLGRLADMVASLSPASRWDRWAAWSIEDDLAVLRRMIAERVLAEFPDSPGVEAVGEFRAGHGELISVWEATIEDLSGSEPDPAALMVALRRLRSLLL